MKRFKRKTKQIKANRSASDKDGDNNSSNANFDELDEFFEQDAAAAVGGGSDSEPEEHVSSKMFENQLLNSIRQLGKQEKIPMKTNILHYYENLRQKKMIDGDMFELVTSVLSVPATQVSVERAFSALAIVMEPLRTSLSGDNVDNILVCALNPELLMCVPFKSL